MTEAEWNAIEDWEPIRSFLQNRDDRKCRLFAATCLSSVARHFIASDRAVFKEYEAAIGTPELADRLRGLRQRVSKGSRLSEVRKALHAALADDAVTSSAGAAWLAITTAASRATTWFEGSIEHRAAAYRHAFDEQICLQWQFLCEHFGPPSFNPVAFDPVWRTTTAVSLAQAIYDNRAFDRLPILADALQDAGCEDADVLAHCRSDGPHVRGCWVVDLVLGKA